MSGRHSEIKVFDKDGNEAVLKLVFTLGAIAEIEREVGRSMTQVFSGANIADLQAVLFHGTRDAHPDLELEDLKKYSRLPLVKIAEAFNRDIGVEVDPPKGEEATSPGK